MFSPDGCAELTNCSCATCKNTSLSLWQAKQLSELLSAFTPGDTIDPIVRPIAQRAKRAGMVKEAKLGQFLEEMAKPMRKAAVASGDPQDWVRKFMQVSERPVALADDVAESASRAARSAVPEDMQDFFMDCFRRLHINKRCQLPLVKGPHMRGPGRFIIVWRLHHDLKICWKIYPVLLLKKKKE